MIDFDPTPPDGFHWGIGTPEELNIEHVEDDTAEDIYVVLDKPATETDSRVVFAGWCARDLGLLDFDDNFRIAWLKRSLLKVCRDYLQEPHEKDDVLRPSGNTGFVSRLP